MVKLGEEEKLSKGNLPLRSQVFAHYLYLRRQKVESGEWKSNVSVNDAARAVKVDVQAQWEKTGIPHSLDGQAGDKKVERLILKCRKMQKKTVEDRDKNFGQEFDSLFDVASCQDKNPESCNCPAGLKVPPNWVAFLQDQRSSRLHTNTLLSDRAQSLLGGIRDLTLEKKMSIRGPLKRLRKKSKGRKGWLRGKENLIKRLTTCSELRDLGFLTTWVKSNLSLVVRMMRIGKTKWTRMRKMVEESITG